VTPFPRGLCNNSFKKATSRLADGMERAETIWPEVTGAGLWNHGGCGGAGVG